MAQPLKARGAASRANLNKGGTHYHGGQRTQAALKRQHEESRTVSRRLLMDDQVQATFLEQLRKGTCQPGVVVALMHYAWGKPKETVETTQVVPVRIVHVYPDEPKAPPVEQGNEEPERTH